jgi:hypothetical protein
MKDSKKEKPEKKEGPVIPAGTEQETGLTRGQTEKPEVKKPGNPKPPDRGISNN